MQRCIARWTCAAIAVLAAPVLSSQSLDNFFDGTQLQEIHLSMNPADWSMLKQNYMADTYYRCDFIWQGVVIKNAGIKSRGTGSRNPIKPGLGIHFGEYNPSQNFLGLQSIVLRNFAQDASMIHERLTMEMFQRLGLPYEREVHTKLFINDAYVGLFLAVEPLDERFTLTRFGESNGYLYEYNWKGQSFYFNYLGADPALYVPGIFEAKTNEYAPQPERIRDMIDAANFSSDADFPAAIETYLDLGSFVTHVAVEQFMAEGDGLMNTDGMRNFYLYRRLADNRFVFLVWDKEETFAGIDFPIFRGTDANVLMRRALAIAEIRQRYLETFLEAAQIAGGPGGWLEQEVTRVLDQIRAALIADPARVCVIGDSGVSACPLDMFNTQENWLHSFSQQRSAFVIDAVAAAGLSMPNPMLMPGGAVNAASLLPVLVPGSLARIEGPLSVSETTLASGLPLPAQLAGVSVWIGGRAAPIAGVSSSGAVVQVPWEVTCGPVSMVVQDQNTNLNTISVEVRPSSPGIFAVTHTDGTLVDAGHPVEPGETVVVYATGLGAPIIAQASGNAPTGVVLLKNQASAFVGELPAQVLWAGLAPALVGLQQINIQMPSGVPSGIAPLQLMMLGERGAPFAVAVH